MDEINDNSDYQIVIRDCELMGYGATLALQQDILGQRQLGEITNTVLLVEHPAVITLGARATENKLLVSEQALDDSGIELHHVRRGGGGTAHNPGQMVMYPILNLRSLDMEVNTYVRDLESVGMELLEQLGVTSSRRKGYPGLWTGEQKIASIGVQIKKWVTFHGIAININNDLSIFDNIVPCGLDSVEMTSVLEITKKQVPMDTVKEILSEICRQHWSQGDI
jgi:lipoate-protein ligase B